MIFKKLSENKINDFLQFPIFMPLCVYNVSIICYDKTPREAESLKLSRFAIVAGIDR